MFSRMKRRWWDLPRDARFAFFLLAPIAAPFFLVGVLIYLLCIGVMAFGYVIFDLK